MLERSGPIDVRHTVDLYDAALSPRKRSVAAQASEGTKGGAPGVVHTVVSEGGDMQQTSSRVCAWSVCLLPVVVLMCVWKNGVWAGWFGEERQARMNPFKTEPHLSSRKASSE